MEPFECMMPKVIFGFGKRKELGALLESWGKKLFLALDPYLDRSGTGDEIINLMKASSIEVVKFTKIDPDPDCFGVDDAANIAREESCDIVLAVGGGSAMDFGKGVAVIARNPGTCWSYTRRRDHTPLVPGENTLPVVTVPSTAGTGSEMTHFAVFTNSKIREKSTIAHESIIPRLAIIDPELTFSCPPKLTALTGIDVLAHAIEAYVNIKASPWAKMVAIEAIRLVSTYLLKAVSNGKNRQARENMAWASTLAGIAIAHSNPTLPHALGQAAGGFVHAPHGASVACCLAEIMRISYDADLEAFSEVACALNHSVRSLPLNERAEQSAVLVEQLLKDIGVDVKFSDFGMQEKDINKVAKIAMIGYFTGITLHPKQVDEEEIKRIYRACL